MKRHPKSLSLEKCTAYFEEATAKAFARAIEAGHEVMGMRDGRLVIFKKGCEPSAVESKAIKAKSPIKTLC